MKRVERLIILYPGETSSERINEPANYALSRLLIELHRQGSIRVQLLNRSRRYERYGNIEFIPFSRINFIKVLAQNALRRNRLIISQTADFHKEARLLQAVTSHSRVIVRLGGVYYGKEYLESEAFAKERARQKRRLAVADMIISTADGTPVDLFMARVGVPPDRYRKWLNGFPVIENGGLYKRGNRIVCISRLSHEKGIDYVVRSFARALPRLREAHTLVVVGDGPELTSLQALAHELSVEARVEFPGRSNDVARHLYSSRLLVSGLANNPVMEAIATGTPVIAVELGEMRALYGEFPNVRVVDYPPGGCGQIAEEHLEGLVNRTADAIVDILNNYHSGNPSHQPSNNLYSWEERLQQEFELWEELMMPMQGK